MKTEVGFILSVKGRDDLSIKASALFSQIEHYTHFFSEENETAKIRANVAFLKAKAYMDLAEEINDGSLYELARTALDVAIKLDPQINYLALRAHKNIILGKKDLDTIFDITKAVDADIKKSRGESTSLASPLVSFGFLANGHKKIWGRPTKENRSENRLKISWV